MGIEKDQKPLHGEKNLISFVFCNYSSKLEEGVEGNLSGKQITDSL